MFTKADLRALVPRPIFSRGESYYANEAVGRITQTANVFSAKVRGTKKYHVELTVPRKGPPKIYCDCPYIHGDVCKHGIALGLAVLDLLGPDKSAPVVDPPVAPPGFNPAAPTTAQLQRALVMALARTSDKEKIAYLGQLLYQKPDLIPAFLDTFEFSLPLLLAATAAKPKPRPAVRTFVQAGAELRQTGHQPDLLPFLLRYDWRHTTEEEAPQLADLLAAAAHLQPEATLDATMERIETYLAANQRSAVIYRRIVGWLTALREVPAIAGEVILFASELRQQHGRRAELVGALTDAGFAALPVDLQEEVLRKKATTKVKVATAATPPKRLGWPPRP